ncbi:MULTISPECIES: TRAP transporter small permease [unclassified Nesterenkonia]|uniref:TRAP transporter small permease n=1 Tax=unclassified Nesterenkonia TaxID=2629769 RepID=UPI0008728C1A|nr:MULTISPECIES: TRAP transporter small permease [unclassified Nesterenkonia]MDS2173743.1 TRAP transporter small permease [Nesterenkonia sp. CL21]
MVDAVLTRVENTVIVLAFITMTGVYFANVVSRYFLHGSLAFTTEIVVNLAVLLTMVGAAAGVRLGTHPGFDLLPAMATGVLRTSLIALIAVGTLVFFLVFLWLGWEMTSRQMAQGRVTPALGVPQWVFSMALPVGAALGAVRSVQAGVIQLRRAAASSQAEGREVLP